MKRVGAALSSGSAMEPSSLRFAGLGPGLIFALSAVVLGCPAVAPRAHGGAGTVAEPPVAGVRVVHRGHGPEAGVRLLGIDRSKRRAFVRIEDREQTSVAIETIDLDTGVRLDRWDATPTHARAIVKDDGDAFHPMSGTFGNDLARFGGMVQASGPWHTRTPRWSPTVVTSNDGAHLLFHVRPRESDGRWLYITDRGSKGARPVGKLAATYDPVFSPDGRRVAFRGCETADPAVCRPSLYVAATEADPIVPKRIEIPEARDLAWSASGRSIYALGDACLHRVEAESGAVYEVFCSTTMSFDGFRVDSSGTKAIVTGMRGAVGAQTYEYVWLNLPGGEPVSTLSIPNAVGPGILSTSGILVAPLQGTRLKVVDLANGHEASVPSGTWAYSDLDAQWLDDHTFVALRSGKKNSFELVSIDARTLIDG